MSRPAATPVTGWRAALGYGACALAACLWGTGFFWGKLALREMQVEHMVLYRFWFAAVVLLPFAMRHRPRFPARSWRMLLLAAFLGIPLSFLLQFYGLALTTVSHASLMIGTMPVLLALGATLFAGERLDLTGWLALLVSTAGTALIVLGGKHAAGIPPTYLWGDLLVIASLLVALGWVLLNKDLMREHSPLVVTTYGVLSGTVMLTAWVLLRTGPPPLAGLSRQTWAALAISGVLCTAATTFLWNWGINQVPASRAGVFLNLEPVLGSLLGVGLLGEHLGPYAYLGGAMIIAAAVVITVQRRQPDVLLE